MASVGHCRGCGESKTLINAHIIPESFCKRLARGGRPAKVLQPDDYVKQSHAGIYDSTILCDDCERKFSAPDGYAQELLLHRGDDFEPVVVDGELAAQRVESYDYDLLHRFIAAVLWRASVSTQSFFKDVNLGSHEEPIKLLAFGERLGGYPFWAGRLVHTTTDNMTPAPIRKRIDGVNYWGVYVGDFHFWVKVDAGRAIPDSLSQVHANPRNPLVFVCRDLKGSPEHQAAIRSVANRKVGRGRNA